MNRLIFYKILRKLTDTASSASFLDLYLEFDDSGQISTKIYDKREDFNFKIINFPNMCSIFWFPETSSSSEKQATGPGLLKDSPYSIS
jgi:hypothetical protein